MTGPAAMPDPDEAARAVDLDRALADRANARYVLALYVAGMTLRSLQAIAAIKSICEEHLQGRYELEVIDVYQQPVRAADDQVVALPTLIKRLPPPLRRLIGDLSDRERTLVALDLRPRPAR